MTILRVRHTTTYNYARPVRFCEHRLLFRPRDSQEQRLLSSELKIDPVPADIHWIHDVFGNCITIVRFDTPASELRFETNIVLDHTPNHGPSFRIEDRAKTWPFEYPAETLPDLAPYLQVHHPDPSVEEWARRFVPPTVETSTGHLLATLTTGIRESFTYSRRTDPGTQLPAETLALRRGTCRDFAWLMIEACRVLGLAARFVTGYIYVPARDAASTRGGGATHAWVQVFLPGAGWVEFDPTNGIVGSRDLIRVGVARRPSQARPLSGSFVGDRADYLGMDVEVRVTTDRGLDQERQRAFQAGNRLRRGRNDRPGGAPGAPS
jgi:transglutaminase-like putative cysteine protease